MNPDGKRDGNEADHGEEDDDNDDSVRNRDGELLQKKMEKKEEVRVCVPCVDVWGRGTGMVEDGVEVGLEISRAEGEPERLSSSRCEGGMNPRCLESH